MAGAANSARPQALKTKSFRPPLPQIRATPEKGSNRGKQSVALMPLLATLLLHLALLHRSVHKATLLFTAPRDADLLSQRPASSSKPHAIRMQKTSIRLIAALVLNFTFFTLFSVSVRGVPTHQWGYDENGNPWPVYHITETPNGLWTDIPSAHVTYQGKIGSSDWDSWLVTLSGGWKFDGFYMTRFFLLDPTDPLIQSNELGVNETSVRWYEYNRQILHDKVLSTQTLFLVKADGSSLAWPVATVLCQDLSTTIPDSGTSVALLGCSVLLVVGMKRLTDFCRL